VETHGDYRLHPAEDAGLLDGYSISSAKRGGTPWLHTHRSRYVGLLLLRNGPANPWLLAPELADTVACARGASCSSAARLRSYLELRAQRLPTCGGRSVLFCHDDPHAPSLVTATTAGGASLRVVRQGRLACRACNEGTLEEGDALTLLAFSGPFQNADTDTYPMHTLVFTHAELLPGATPQVTGANVTGIGWDVSRVVDVHPLLATRQQ